MQKKKLLQDIFEIVDRSREAADFHQREVESMKSFYEYATKIVKNEAPEFEQKFAEIMEHFKNAVDREMELVEAERRTAEDINDVAVRFDVVYRVSDETVEKTAAVKKCSQNIKQLRDKLQDDLSKGGGKQHSIQAEIQAAIEAKKKAVEEADLKLQEFIKVKESYNTFKVNRLRHAYVSYGEALSRCLRECSNQYTQLAAACNISTQELDDLLSKGIPAPETTENQ